MKDSDRINKITKRFFFCFGSVSVPKIKKKISFGGPGPRTPSHCSISASHCFNPWAMPTESTSHRKRQSDQQWSRVCVWEVGGTQVLNWPLPIEFETLMNWRIRKIKPLPLPLDMWLMIIKLMVISVFQSYFLIYNIGMPTLDANTFILCSEDSRRVLDLSVSQKTGEFLRIFGITIFVLSKINILLV